MGLLDNFDFGDPQTLGLLSAAAQMFERSGPSTTPRSIGQVMSSGLMGGLQGYHGAQQMQQQQRQHQQQQEMLMEKVKMLKLDEARKQQAMDMQKMAMSRFMGGQGGAQGATPDMTSAFSAPGRVGPTNERASLIPQTQFGQKAQGSNEAFDLDTLRALSIAGVPGAKELFEIHKYENEPRKLEQGSTYVDRRSGSERFIPKLDSGIAVNNGVASFIPGYAEAVAGQAGLTADAQEKVKSGNDLVSVNLPGGPRQMTRQQAVSMARGTPQAGAQPNSGYPAGVQVPQPTPPMPMQRGQSDQLTILQQELAQETDPANRAALTREIAALASAAPPARQQAQQLVTQGDGAPGIALQTEPDKKLGVGRADITVEREKDRPLALASFQSSVSGLDRLAAEAKAILADPQLTRITGIMSSIPNMPGSGASDIAARLETLKSQTGFSVLQAMRDASKTGGALGSVSNEENKMLQNNLAALDPKQSTQAFRNSMQRVIDYVEATKTRLALAYKETYGQDASDVKNTAAKVRRYNPSTGRIE